jgi:hypothetical protein
MPSEVNEGCKRESKKRMTCGYKNVENALVNAVHEKKNFTTPLPKSQNTHQQDITRMFMFIIF